ncbi:hypothetical protein JST97_29585 [bacterium]|nr:hypothetical protein [bacterium]
MDEAVGSLMLPIWHPNPLLTANATFRVLSSDGELVVEAPENEPLRTYRQDFLQALERRIHFYLANHCQDVVFVHAGAVALGGQVILIPGSSYSGKSTLTHSLVRAGAEYFSDEYAVVDRLGRVHPFPRPIALRSDGGRRVSPPRAGLKPAAVRAVIATQFQSGSSWRPNEESQGAAALKLMAHTVTARKSPALSLACLSACVSGAIYWAGARGEADETAELILQVLEPASNR